MSFRCTLAAKGAKDSTTPWGSSSRARLLPVSTQTPIAFDSFAENRATGSFIIIDRISNATVGADMIVNPLRRAANIHWQAMDVNKASRAAKAGQKPTILWFTGLSGSGKSTIANLVEKALAAEGKHT